MAAPKQVSAIIKLQVKAGEANPSPPVGPALGQHGVAIMDFCKAFNDQTKEMEKGLVLPVEITVFSDRSFTFIIKQPPASVLILKEVGLPKGSSAPPELVGKLTKAQVQNVAEKKMKDLSAGSLEAAMRTIEGTARSMGVEIVD